MEVPELHGYEHLIQKETKWPAFWTATLGYVEGTS
jgi:hypothetical protein